MDGIVDLGPGRVRGERRDGVWRFAGVPYARSPEGPLRWRPPQRPEPWSGVRDACDPGPIAPQAHPMPGSSLPDDPSVQSEDCLHLTVWTPALDAARRPVFVWIHGGGFTTGTAGSRLYDGTHLAVAGDLVVVAVNYRLGALGFLAHPSLAEDSGCFGNWGLLDQIAALRWVRDHIEAFGGDPGRVTVCGESAGAMAVSSMLTMPSAKGLFHGAVIESGPPYTHSAERAAEAATEVVRELGLSDVARDLLEGVPADDLVGAVNALTARSARPGELPLPLLPVIDGVSLPRDPYAAVADGVAGDVALLVGTNRDELSFFLLTEWNVPMDESALLHRLLTSAPTLDPAAIAAAYRDVRTRRGEPVTPRDIWIAAGSDLVFRWPSLHLAAAQRRHQPRTFAYLFTWQTPILGGVLGACHALEIPFVFGTVRTPAVAAYAGGGPAAEAFSDDVAAAWIEFIRKGDPSQERTGPWPAWDTDTRATMVLGPGPHYENRPRDEELGVWETAYPFDRSAPVSPDEVDAPTGSGLAVADEPPMSLGAEVGG